MGCWNQTCGLSNLHIRAGQDVVVFAMVKTRKLDSLCYTTPFYEPVMLPFYAKYNDYGGGEECSGPGLALVMEAIKKNLVELPQGENQFHDIPVKKEGFNDAVFFEACHERRLFVKGYHARERRHVEFVMFHKAVWDHIFEHREIEKYVGDNKGTTGWNNAYIKYKFTDLVAGVPEVVDFMFKALDDKDNPYRLWEPLANVRELREHNLAADWLAYGDNHRYGNLLRPNSFVSKCMENNNREGAVELLTEYLRALFIDGFMGETRKHWSPQTGAGSQSDEENGYRVLISAMNSVLDAEHREWAEENEE